MSKIKVMVVDDSALMRRILNQIFAKDEEIEVVGSISNAVYALSMIDHLKPDVITMDIEMPGMDGITALTEIRKKLPKLPVIMCSSMTLNGATVTLDALAKGANDYVTKPSSSGSLKESYEVMGPDLINKIKIHTKPEATQLVAPIIPPVKTTISTTRTIDVVAIGISTGGPNALTDLLPKIPQHINVPIVIVQHMPPVFTKILAENLAKKSSIPVKEAEDGEVLLPGTAYIAPGNFHMTVERDGLKQKIKLNQEPAEHFCRPAVDVLFRSLTPVFKSNILAVVMTGMGHDGLLGCKEIKNHGGLVLIQDQESSVVWGMPGAIYKEGLADAMYPLTKLSQAITECVANKGRLI